MAIGPKTIGNQCSHLFSLQFVNYDYKLCMNNIV